MVYRHLLNFWSLVPALDLKELATLSNPSIQENNSEKYSDELFQSYKLKPVNTETVLMSTADKDFNCLLVGSSLGCLIKTLARAGRHGNQNLNIYVADIFPESLTRCLILLALMNASTSEFSLLEKSETFLEILGNIYVRSSTAAYVEKVSSELFGEIGCPKQSTSVLPIVSLDMLKQTEIDDLVGVLTYLKDKDKSFDIGKTWENALRSYYGQRFDSRKNLFDYHFNMRLCDYSIINLRKYLDWCETGVAFKFRKSKYISPNKTMRVLLRDSRQNKSFVDTFVGDIATSPYLMFGVETGNSELLKKVNNEFIYTSEDISKFNVIDMLEEYALFDKRNRKTSIKVHLSFFNTMCKNRKLSKTFDAIYISCDMMHCANKLIPAFLKEQGVVVFETIKNVVNSTKEQKEKHSEEIDLIAKSSGLKVMKHTNSLDSGNFKVFIQQISMVI